VPENKWKYQTTQNKYDLQAHHIRKKQAQYCYAERGGRDACLETRRENRQRYDTVARQTVSHIVFSSRKCHDPRWDG
jgi:hypothetical protein